LLSIRTNARLIIGLLLAASQVLPALAGAAGFQPIDGSKRLKADLVAVFAHPDDETGMAPTLAYYAWVQNKRIPVSVSTRGALRSGRSTHQPGPAQA